MSYRPIEHHAVIGDLHTVALVALDGTIDWLCLPHFDSPSVFASILDSEKGGHFRVTAVSEDARRRQMYLPDSNVLVTRFLTPDGVGEIVDLMPIHEQGTSRKKKEDHQFIRLVRGVRGWGFTKAISPAPRERRTQENDSGTSREGCRSCE